MVQERRTQAITRYDFFAAGVVVGILLICLGSYCTLQKKQQPPPAPAAVAPAGASEIPFDACPALTPDEQRNFYMLEKTREDMLVDWRQELFDREELVWKQLALPIIDIEDEGETQ